MYCVFVITHITQTKCYQDVYFEKKDFHIFRWMFNHDVNPILEAIPPPPIGKKTNRRKFVQSKYIFQTYANKRKAKLD